MTGEVNFKKLVLNDGRHDATQREESLQVRLSTTTKAMSKHTITKPKFQNLIIADRISDLKRRCFVNYQQLHRIGSLLSVCHDTQIALHFPERPGLSSLID